MFELLISDKVNGDISLKNVAKRIKRDVQLSKGVFVHDEFSGRERICLAVPEKMSEYIYARVKEEIIEHIAVEYKYKYFKEHLEIPMLDDFFKTAFLSALAVFDKATDKRYIAEHLAMGEEINIDSCFAFRLPLLVDRWNEIVALVKQNMLELSPNDGLIEMMKFLLSQSPNESEEVVVATNTNGAAILNARGEEQFAFLAGEQMMPQLIHQLITLLPGRVVLTSNNLGKVKEIFDAKVLMVQK